MKLEQRIAKLEAKNTKPALGFWLMPFDNLYGGNFPLIWVNEPFTGLDSVYKHWDRLENET